MVSTTTTTTTTTVDAPHGSRNQKFKKFSSLHVGWLSGLLACWFVRFAHRQAGRQAGRLAGRQSAADMLSQLDSEMKVKKRFAISKKGCVLS